MSVLSHPVVPNSLRPMNCSLPGSSVHGISQARILEWVVSSFSGGSSWLKDWTRISRIGRQILYYWRHPGSPFQVNFYSVVNIIHQLNKFHLNTYSVVRFPGGSDGKDSAWNAGNQGLMPRLGGSPGEGTGNPLQYSCLENSMDSDAWWAFDRKELDITERLTLSISLYLNTNFFARYLFQIKKFTCCWAIGFNNFENPTHLANSDWIFLMS